MNAYEIQQERKRNEREPIDWDKYRAALIESGMVRESWQRRHVANFGFECDMPEDLDETCEHYLAGAGMAQADPPFEIRTNGRDLFGEPKTLVDQLYEDKYGGL